MPQFGIYCVAITRTHLLANSLYCFYLLSNLSCCSSHLCNLKLASSFIFCSKKVGVQFCDDTLCSWLSYFSIPNSTIKSINKSQKELKDHVKTIK